MLRKHWGKPGAKPEVKPGATLRSKNRGLQKEPLGGLAAGSHGTMGGYGQDTSLL